MTGGLRREKILVGWRARKSGLACWVDEFVQLLAQIRVEWVDG